MPVPVLLVTGFLGAGKTTLINRLLTDSQGRRLAAVVNDFGAVDIDAALLAGVGDGVVSLKNGCICCSLQGDLLQTLSTILRRDPVPDGIVIETSGVSDPAEIVRLLLDPVLWREAPLDAVVCMVDARQMADQPRLLEDTLVRSQLRAADFVVLNKADLVSPAELASVQAMLSGQKPRHLITTAEGGKVAGELLFSAGLHRPLAAPAPKRALSTPDFDQVSWTSQSALSLRGFQLTVARFAAALVRAKGIVTFDGRPGERMVFQLVGQRATLGPAPAGTADGAAVRLVFIARTGTLDGPALRHALASCVGLAD